MNLVELSDRAEIADVLTRYTIAVDTDAWDLLDEVFTPDAHIDYSESGGIIGNFSETKAWLAEVLPKFSIKRMPTLGQIAAAFAEGRDEAEVTAYFNNPMVVSDGKGGQRLVEIGGIYHHHFVRTLAGWRSRRLHEQMVWKKGL
jgi:SnoaL-like domain